MSSSLLLASTLIFAQPESADPNSKTLDQFLLGGCSASEACLQLSLLTGQSISVSAKAAEVPVILSLHDCTAQAALESLVKSSGLAWRRDDKSGVISVMTVEEYRNGLQLIDSPEIRTFKVEPANLGTIAEAVAALYGERAQLSYGSRPRDFSQESVETIGGGGGGSGDGNNDGNNNGNNNNGNNNNSNRNGGLSRSTSGFSNNVQQAQPLSNVSSQGAADIERARQSGAPVVNNPQLTGIINPIYVTVIQEHSLVLIRSSDAKVLEDVTRLVERLDKKVPQVLLEMKILKLKLSDGMTSAFDYDIGRGSHTSTTPGDRNLNPLNSSSSSGREHLGGVGNFPVESSSTMVYQYLDDNLRARIQLLASTNRVETLATPLLVATNNRAARIVVGEEKVITTGATTQSLTNQNGIVNQTVAYTSEIRDVGTTLRLIPYINEDDTVTMYIEQDNSSIIPRGNTIIVSDPVAGPTQVLVDAVDTARVLATVNAKNNLAVAVGGLIRNENSKSIQKVPWLGDIPYLGWFFRREVNSTEKTELVLLITPRIIRSGEEGQSITRARAAELSSHGWHSFGQAGTDIQNSQIEKYRKDVEGIEKKLLEDAEKAAHPDAKKAE